MSSERQLILGFFFLVVFSILIYFTLFLTDFQLFGERFEAMFVFAYHVVGDIAPLPPELLFEHRGKLYGFVAMRLRDYAACAKVISPKWQTVAVPTARFRDLAEPVGRFLGRRWRLESGQEESEAGALELQR